MAEASSHMAPNAKQPIIIFINSRSGGGQGAELMAKFAKIVPPAHIFDLSAGGPAAGLKQWKESGLPFRVLVCGGDGSACWVLGEMDKLYPVASEMPPVAILPLGTGNDLARVLNWGGGYSSLSGTLQDIVMLVHDAVVSPLDRWKLQITPNDGSAIRSMVLNNYFSFGIDAKIALKFHELREANPHLFPHRAVNKAWYANYGMLEMLKTSHPLASYTTLKVDDAVIPLNETVASIIVLNIPSYTGGSDLWGKPKSKEKQWKPAMMNDGVLEVVSISGVFHMGSIQAHLAKAKKIAQGARVEIESRELGYLQVDGEPWAQPPCRITVSHFNCVNMLRRAGAADRSVHSPPPHHHHQHHPHPESQQHSHSESPQAKPAWDHLLRRLRLVDEDDDGCHPAVAAVPTLSAAPASPPPVGAGALLASSSSPAVMSRGSSAGVGGVLAAPVAVPAAGPLAGSSPFDAPANSYGTLDSSARLSVSDKDKHHSRRSPSPALPHHEERKMSLEEGRRASQEGVTTRKEKKEKKEKKSTRAGGDSKAEANAFQQHPPADK